MISPIKPAGIASLGRLEHSLIIDMFQSCFFCGYMLWTHVFLAEISLSIEIELKEWGAYVIIWCLG